MGMEISESNTSAYKQMRLPNNEQHLQRQKNKNHPQTEDPNEYVQGILDSARPYSMIGETSAYLQNNMDEDWYIIKPEQTAENEWLAYGGLLKKYINN